MTVPMREIVIGKKLHFRSRKLLITLTQNDGENYSRHVKQINFN